MLLTPGYYRVIWRLQFFDPHESERDRQTILDRTLELMNSRQNSCDGTSTTSDSSRDPGPLLNGYKNVMGFPRWPGHDEASYPHCPALRLSIGYGRSPRHVKDYQLLYGLNKEPIADQVLLPRSACCPRLDLFVDPHTYHSNKDNGWINLENQEERFEIVSGRQPVLVVSNIDTGSWQGGFRFGGVELQRVDAMV